MALPRRTDAQKKATPWTADSAFYQINFISPVVHPTEGHIAIVTNAGLDAMDAAAPLTNGAQADGEVVWS
jgi:hypothetical protein